MQAHPIYINLFGTGVRYHVCELPISTFEKMEEIRSELNTQWEYLFFDFDFLEHFGFQHWTDMAIETEQAGFLLDPMNRIEIKQAQRIISRFYSNELSDGDTLFPLHNTIKEVISLNSTAGNIRFAIFHLEKGLIGKYQLATTNFHIDDLQYQLKTIKDYEFLSTIYYQGQQLQRKKDDSVATSSFILWE